MVYVTGDCHANWTKFGIHRFLEQKEMTREDFVIVCGDFGIWHDNAAERYWFNWLAEKSFTILFVDGNHENFDRLYSDEFEVVDLLGGKAHKIRDNIYHLMRGYVFEIEGKKFFTMGGASCHDIDDGILDRADYKSEEEFKQTIKDWNFIGKMFRVNHFSWWKEELPSDEELAFARENLKQHNYKVDYVITHCLPQSLACVLGFHGAEDKLTIFFDELLNEGLQFNRWYCGHYHLEEDLFCKKQAYTIKFDDIERIL